MSSYLQVLDRECSSGHTPSLFNRQFYSPSERQAICDEANQLRSQYIAAREQRQAQTRQDMDDLMQGLAAGALAIGAGQSQPRPQPRVCTVETSGFGALAQTYMVCP